MELLAGEKALSVSNHGFGCYPLNFSLIDAIPLNETKYQL